VLYVASAARLHVLGEQLPDWAAGITAGALSSLVPRAIQLRRTVIRGWHPGTERESLYDKLLRIYVVAAYRNYIKKAPWTDIRNAIIIGVSAVYSAYELADKYIRMTEARPLTEPERGWLREVIDSRALSSARKARVVAIRVAQEDRATALRLAARRAPAIVALRAHMALGFQPPEPTRPKAQDKTKSAGSPT